MIGGHQLVIGVSIGVALAPEDGDDPDQLLKNADLALYRAKAEGRGTYRFFEAGMDARAQARRLLELDLRMAVRREEFELHYQPIVDVSQSTDRGASRRWCAGTIRSAARFRRELHSARRGDRADRAARRVGAAQGLPGCRRLAARRSALRSTCRRCSSRIRTWCHR